MECTASHSRTQGSANPYCTHHLPVSVCNLSGMQHIECNAEKATMEHSTAERSVSAALLLQTLPPAKLAVAVVSCVCQLTAVCSRWWYQLHTAQVQSRLQIDCVHSGCVTGNSCNGLTQLHVADHVSYTSCTERTQRDGQILH